MVSITIRNGLDWGEEARELVGGVFPGEVVGPGFEPGVDPRRGGDAEPLTLEGRKEEGRRQVDIDDDSDTGVMDRELSSSSNGSISWIRQAISELGILEKFGGRVTDARVSCQLPRIARVYRDSGLSDEQFREWLVYAADVAARATCRDEWMYFVGVLANSVGERAAEMPPAGDHHAAETNGGDPRRFLESRYSYLYA